MSPQGVPRIGKSWPRRDSFTKAAGAEKFASDLYPAGLLWLGVKRAAHPHARILEIDTADAAAVPGVYAVLTHRDIRGTNRTGVPEFDQPVLCDGKVRHLGDPVALVLAESKAVLAGALDRIRVVYEVLPAVFDAEAAMAPGALPVHEEAPHGNVLLSGSFKTGAGAEALAQCAFTAEGTFHLPRQEHAYLETECGVARVEEDGTLVVTASTQTPFRDRYEVAASLGLAPEKVRVVAPYLGGGFGGKDGITVQGLLGLAAFNAGGRPVKIHNSREESFRSSSKRHPAKVEYAIGCRADGTLHALRCRIVMDTGAYACLGGAVLALAVEHAGGIYRFPNAFAEGYCVYTNNPIAGAFRGFGVPQVAAALEQLVDELAAKVGLDPLEFRLRNALEPGDATACGAHLGPSFAVKQCLETVRGHRLWRERAAWVAAAPPLKRRGVGLAAAMHGMGYGPVVPDTGNAKVELMPDGTLTVYAGVTDMGQGNIATFLAIAAAALNQPVEDIGLVLPDTARTLPSGSSSASRTTFTYGNALRVACGRLRVNLLERAVAVLAESGGPSIPMGELSLEPGAVRHLPSTRTVTLRELAARMDAEARLGLGSFTARVSQEHVPVDKALRQWGIPHTIFSSAVHLACVEVDEATGETTVCRYLACTDAGKILNPMAFEQQVHGGVAQGLGYALFEDFRTERGAAAATNFTTYIVPTAMDVGDIESLAVEAAEPDGPHGMKGLGEIVIDPVYPAVANAIAGAVQARIARGPMTAERVLAALGEVRP